MTGKVPTASAAASANAAGVVAAAALVTLALAASSAFACQSHWRYPPDCQANCSYHIVWRYRKQADTLDFIVTTRHTKRWTGIGFSRNKSMIESDALLGWIEDNRRYVMMDAWMPSQATPIADRSQDVHNISAATSDGLISFKFSRKADTGDPQDLAFNSNQCLYFIYPVGGGPVDIANRTIQRHSEAPVFSEQPICLHPCNKLEAQQPTPSPPAPALSSPVSNHAPHQRASPPPAAAVFNNNNNNAAAIASPAAASVPRLHFPSPSFRKPPSSSPSLASSTTTTSTTTSTTTTTPAPTTTLTTTIAPTTTTSTTTTTPAPQTTPTPSTTTSTTTTPTTITTTTTAPTTTLSTQQSTTTPASSTSQIPDPASQKPLILQLSQHTNTQQQTPASSPNSSGDLSQQQQQQWCVGRWTYPPNCRLHSTHSGSSSSSSAEALQYLQRPVSGSLTIRPVPLEQSDCSYFAQWQYVEATDSIDFIIQTKSRNKWTGIGFSNATKMTNSDAILALFEEHSGRHFIMDTWLKDHVAPELDRQQNTDNSSARRENGTVTVRFSRKRLTGDPLDFQFTDDSCAFFFFPVQGGHFNAISKKLSIHEKTPFVSKQRICIKRCAAASAPPEAGDHASEPPSPSSPAVADDDKGVFADNASQQRPNVALSISGDASSPSPASSDVSQHKAGDASAPQLSSNSITPANDLSAELDSSSSPAAGSSSSSRHALNGSAAGSTSGANNTANSTSVFRQFAFLNEPSLRWLAAIGCVATLLSMIVFQACFTLYRNKQAQKQNMYNKNALKQNAYLHGAFIADAHNAQLSASSDETRIVDSQQMSAMVAKAGAGQHHLIGHDLLKASVKRAAQADRMRAGSQLQHHPHAHHLAHPHVHSGHYRAAMRSHMANAAPHSDRMRGSAGHFDQHPHAHVHAHHVALPRASASHYRAAGRNLAPLTPQQQASGHRLVSHHNTGVHQAQLDAYGQPLAAHMVGGYHHPPRLSDEYESSSVTEDSSEAEDEEDEQNDEQLDETQIFDPQLSAMVAKASAGAGQHHLAGHDLLKASGTRAPQTDRPRGHQPHPHAHQQQHPHAHHSAHPQGRASHYRSDGRHLAPRPQANAHHHVPHHHAVTRSGVQQTPVDVYHQPLAAHIVGGYHHPPRLRDDYAESIAESSEAEDEEEERMRGF